MLRGPSPVAKTQNLAHSTAQALRGPTIIAKALKRGHSTARAPRGLITSQDIDVWSQHSAGAERTNRQCQVFDVWSQLGLSAERITRHCQDIDVSSQHSTSAERPSHECEDFVLCCIALFICGDNLPPPFLILFTHGGGSIAHLSMFELRFGFQFLEVNRFRISAQARVPTDAMLCSAFSICSGV